MALHPSLEWQEVKFIKDNTFTIPIVKKFHDSIKFHHRGCDRLLNMVLLTWVGQGYKFFN